MGTAIHNHRPVNHKGGGFSLQLMVYGDAQRFKGAFSSLGPIGISMGGFPFKTQCAQFAKSGVFRKIRPKSTKICSNWVFLRQFGIVMG